MRKITEIIIHCSATIEGKDYTVADIDRWHRARGFRKIGYHYVIYRDGSIHAGRPISETGAHCAGTGDPRWPASCAGSASPLTGVPRWPAGYHHWPPVGPNLGAVVNRIS